MQFVERLRGKIDLDTGHGKKAYQAEITLYFEEKVLRDLFACTDDPKGTAHTLTVATRNAPANMVSRLRLFDQTAWEKVRAEGFSGRELEEKLESLSLLTAPLTGKLTIMGREPTGYWQRIMNSSRAWLANRGLRDGWQRLAAKDAVQQPRKVAAMGRAGADQPNMLSSLLRVLSRAGEVRLFEYDLTLGTPLIDTLKLVTSRNKTIRGTKRISYLRRSNPLEQLSTATLSEFPGWRRRSDPAVLELVPEFLARKGLPLFRIVQQQDAPQALVDLLSLATYFVRLFISIHLLTFRLPDAHLAGPRKPAWLPGKLPGLPDPEPAGIPVEEEVDGRPAACGRDSAHPLSWQDRVKCTGHVDTRLQRQRHHVRASVIENRPDALSLAARVGCLGTGYALELRRTNCDSELQFRAAGRNGYPHRGGSYLYSDRHRARSTSWPTAWVPPCFRWRYLIQNPR